MPDFDLQAFPSLEPHPGQHLPFNWLHSIQLWLPHTTETCFTKPIQMTGKLQLAIQVAQLPQNQMTNLSENPSQDLDHGGCDPPEQLDNRLDLPRVTPEVQETTPLG